MSYQKWLIKILNKNKRIEIKRSSFINKPIIRKMISQIKIEQRGLFAFKLIWAGKYLYEKGKISEAEYFALVEKYIQAKHWNKGYD